MQAAYRLLLGCHVILHYTLGRGVGGEGWGVEGGGRGEGRRERNSTEHDCIKLRRLGMIALV